MTHPLWVIAVLAGVTAASEWLVRKTALRHLGSALLVIVLAAVAANLQIIPSVTDGSPVYDHVFSTVGPLAIFWLLLQVDLRSVLRAGAPMLVLFSLGAAGTFAGVLVAMALLGGEVFGPLHAALGGMYVGTYVGGSINFNAVALEYDVMRDGVLYAGAAVVDNVATTLWMAATVVLPRLLAGRWRVRGHGVDGGETGVGGEAAALADAPDPDRFAAQGLTAEGLAVQIGLGAAALWLSDLAAAWLAEAVHLPVPSILILTTLALLLAQIPAIQRLPGTHLIGWTAVMLFLAAIGALCDLGALARLGSLAPSLVALVGITIAVHGLAVFGGAALLRLDPTVAAVASQANIGGGTSALALATSLDREDLELPAILVGSLGNAIGTYLGFLTVLLLR
jgi:uncharacterized membrane protein